MKLLHVQVLQITKILARWIKLEVYLFFFESVKPRETKPIDSNFKV